MNVYKIWLYHVKTKKSPKLTHVKSVKLQNNGLNSKEFLPFLLFYPLYKYFNSSLKPPSSFPLWKVPSAVWLVPFGNGQSALLISLNRQIKYCQVWDCRKLLFVSHWMITEGNFLFFISKGNSKGLINFLQHCTLLYTINLSTCLNSRWSLINLLDANILITWLNTNNVRCWCNAFSLWTSCGRSQLQN